MRISFYSAPHAIVGMLRGVHLARAGTQPQHLQRLFKEAAHFALLPGRPGHSIAREVERSARRKCPPKKMPVRA